MVATLDVKDFFPSVHYRWVERIWRELGFSRSTARLLTRLTTHNGELPQGAPTSCALANLAFASADKTLLDLAEYHDLSYTRYIDDLALSADWDFRGLRNDIAGAVHDLGLRVKRGVVCFTPAERDQIVVGLRVNTTIEPSPKWLQELRTELEGCVQDGPSACDDGTHRSYRLHLKGKVDFAWDANREIGRELKSLYGRIDWCR